MLFPLSSHGNVLSSLVIPCESPLLLGHLMWISSPRSSYVDLLSSLVISCESPLLLGHLMWISSPPWSSHVNVLSSLDISWQCPLLDGCGRSTYTYIYIYIYTYIVWLWWYSSPMCNVLISVGFVFAHFTLLLIFRTQLGYVWAVQFTMMTGSWIASFIPHKGIII